MTIEELELLLSYVYQLPDHETAKRELVPCDMVQIGPVKWFSWPPKKWHSSAKVERTDSKP